MRVPAITDNLGNTHTVQSFLTSKFPLSLLVMELSCQLGMHRLELDLSWAPRDQNEEADALTNEDFEGFSANNRIEVDVEKLPFIVLGRLLDRAMELDGSIKLARSSKEAKEDQERSKKKQRSNMRWEQPW